MMDHYRYKGADQSLQMKAMNISRPSSALTNMNWLQILVTLNQTACGAIHEAQAQALLRACIPIETCCMEAKN